MVRIEPPRHAPGVAGRKRDGPTRRASSGSLGGTAPGRPSCSRSSRGSEPTPRSLADTGPRRRPARFADGFHPESCSERTSTSNRAVLGMSRREIKRSFEEIVEFAGVARFLDTPVKRYSSVFISLSRSPSPRISRPRSWPSITRRCCRRPGIPAEMSQQDGFPRGGKADGDVRHPHLDAVARLCLGRRIRLDGAPLAAYGPTEGSHARRTRPRAPRVRTSGPSP